MSVEIDAPLSAKEVLRQLMHAASNGATFKSFLQSHLAEDAKGTVAPRYNLNKSQIIQRLSEIFAMVTGGSASMLSTAPRRYEYCS